MSSLTDNRGLRGAGAWWPLYVAATLAATLSPGLFLCAAQPASWTVGLRDVIENVALFIPMGMMLHRNRVIRMLAIAAFSSMGIEAVQLWLPRVSSPWDILANVTGCTIGGLLSRARFPRRAELYVLGNPSVSAPLAIVILLAGLASHPPTEAHDLSNWEPYPLIIGNERTSDRPWHGLLREFAIFDRALAEEEEPLPEGGPEAWENGGPILWFRFEAPSAGVIDGPRGARELRLERLIGPLAKPTAEGLELAGGLVLFPEPVAQHVMRRLMSSARLSLTARFQPAKLSITGPGRIISMSQDPYLRNFTLGQERQDIEVRIRTTAAGLNGRNPSTTTFGDPLTQGDHHVTAVFDGRTTRIYVDGKCEGSNVIVAERVVGKLGLPLPLSIVLSVGFGALGLAVWAKRLPRLVHLAFFLCGGGGSWAILWMSDAWLGIPEFDSYAVGAGLIALAAALPLLPRQRRLAP